MKKDIEKILQQYIFEEKSHDRIFAGVANTDLIEELTTYIKQREKDAWMDGYRDCGQHQKETGYIEQKQKEAVEGFAKYYREERGYGGSRIGILMTLVDQYLQADRRSKERNKDE